MSGALALALAAAVAWGVLLVGRGFFWRARPFRPPSTRPAVWPEVVAVVPARDEAETIGACVTALLAQDYPGPLRVIVVDDHSTDGTADLARAAGDARLTVVAARRLEPGWTGKLWALDNGVAAVSGQPRWLWFTDADITHPPDTLAGLVRAAEAEDRHLISLMVRLRCETLAERATVPAFVYFFAMLYPFAWIADPRARTAGAAGGCVLVRRDSLAKAGGLAAIGDRLIDDCALAGLIKRQGAIRLELADGSRSLRGYAGFGDVRRMIARTAYTQLRRDPLLLAGCLAGMGLTFLAPPLLALFAEGAPRWIGAAVWLAMAASLVPMLRYYRQSLMWAPTLPLVAGFYLFATVDSAWKHWTGRGGAWKGRMQAVSR